MKSNVVEIEVDSPKNGSLVFAPIQKKVRGRYDDSRVIAEYVKRDARKYPGQVIGLDLESGVGYIRETLHEDRYESLRIRLSQQWSIPQERREYQSTDVPTWLHWMRRAVDGGLARVVKGVLPEKIEGTPRKEWNVPKSRNRARVLEKVLAVLMANLTPEQKQSVEGLLGDA